MGYYRTALERYCDPEDVQARKLLGPWSVKNSRSKKFLKWCRLSSCQYKVLKAGFASWKRSFWLILSLRLLFSGQLPVFEVSLVALLKINHLAIFWIPSGPRTKRWIMDGVCLLWRLVVNYWYGWRLTMVITYFLCLSVILAISLHGATLDGTEPWTNDNSAGSQGYMPFRRWVFGMVGD